MTREPRDRVEIEGLKGTDHAMEGETLGPRRKFLSVHFRCCSTYGRLYINEAETKYEGRCPRCGARTSARIGPGGSAQRIFDTS